MKESARYEEAREAYNRGEEATAILSLSALADAGDAHAGTFLAHILGDSTLVRKEWGRRLYETAALAGCPVAAIAMGETRTESGDFTEARRWFSLAANVGDPDGQAALGDLWINGQGGPQSHAEAAYWYARAAVATH